MGVTELRSETIVNLLSSNLPRRYVKFSKTVGRSHEVWDYKKNNKIPQRYFFQEQNEDIKTSGEKNDEKKKKLIKKFKKRNYISEKKNMNGKKVNNTFL